jgi:chromosome segregation ATPase
VSTPEAQAVELLRRGVSPDGIHADEYRKAVDALEAALKEKDERIARLDRELFGTGHALANADERIAELEYEQGMADAALTRADAMHEALKDEHERAEAEVERLRRARDRAIFLAEHLWQMVPQEVWREHGAEWQGQYEGDYHAEQVREELAALANDESDQAAMLANDESGERCEKCHHDPHEPGSCGVNVGTGHFGPVLCRCGANDESGRDG